MARHKHATIRYQALDRCFRNAGRRYFLEDLLEACNSALESHVGIDAGISVRQLYEDITFMESEAGWQVPLARVRTGRRTYYRYSDPHFSINNQPLNEQEYLQLQVGMDLLARFTGMPEIADLQQLAARMRPGESGNVQTLIGLDHNPYLTGLPHLGPLFLAILYQKVLLVSYRDFRSESATSFVFHPYYLKQYNKRWFVFGRHAEEGISNWTLALDRIQAIEEQSLPFHPNTDILWEEYFDDIVGVTRIAGSVSEEIELWVAPETAPYLLTKPLHGSQRKIRHDAEGLILRLHLIPNVEFYQLLLSFGQHVRVLRPASVVAHLRTSLFEAWQRYE